MTDDTDSTDQIEQVDDASEHVEDATEDVTTNTRWFARGYTLLFVLGILGAIAGSLHFGYVTPTITVNATVNVGWLVEYVVIFLAGVFVFWTTAMMLIALPVGFLSGMMSAVARIADAYEMPDN